MTDSFARIKSNDITVKACVNITGCARCAICGEDLIVDDIHSQDDEEVTIEVNPCTNCTTQKPLKEGEKE